MRERHVRWFGVLRCTVCGFPFSDWHHKYPQAVGGRKSGLIALCPNHHRCTHMIYAMVDAGATDDYIWQFVETHFDEVFLTEFLSDLVGEYRQMKALMTVAQTALSRWLVKAAVERIMNDQEGM